MPHLVALKLVTRIWALLLRLLVSLQQDKVAISQSGKLVTLYRDYDTKSPEGNFFRKNLPGKLAFSSPTWKLRSQERWKMP